MKTMVTRFHMACCFWALLVLFALPSAALARDELSPTYTATLVEGEFKRLDQVDGAKLTGIWLVQFLSGETFQMLLNGEVMVDGFWSFADGRLTLTDLSGPLVCAEESADTATYRVTVSGFSISLQAETDRCPERSAVLNLGDFRTLPR